MGALEGAQAEAVDAGEDVVGGLGPAEGLIPGVSQSFPADAPFAGQSKNMINRERQAVVTEAEGRCALVSTAAAVRRAIPFRIRADHSRWTRFRR